MHWEPWIASLPSHMCTLGILISARPGSLRHWRPSRPHCNGGKLEDVYEQEAGCVKTQVMSAASDVFFGAIGQHEPEDMTFGEFLGLARPHGSDAAPRAGPARAASEQPAAAGRPPAPVPRHGDSGAAAPPAADEAESKAAAGPSPAACPAVGARAGDDDSMAAGTPLPSAQTGAGQDDQPGRHYYLAQADLPCSWQSPQGGGAAANTHAAGGSGEASPGSSLAALAVDFQPPALLRGVAAGKLQKHLWMSIRQGLYQHMKSCTPAGCAIACSPLGCCSGACASSSYGQLCMSFG